MIDVNDLLARVLEGVEALCESYGLNPDSYPIFKEAHDYLDSLEQPTATKVQSAFNRVVTRLDSLERRATILERDIVALYDGAARKESLKNANSLREAIGDEAYDQAMNAALFDIRLTRLEGVVRESVRVTQQVHDVGCAEKDCPIHATYRRLLDTLKEAE